LRGFGDVYQSMEQWSRVKELFHGALERAPAARAAFLDTSCGNDATLRAEVERLLAAHEDAGTFIERSPVATTGRVIGHYEIEQLIGAGGMGEVYRARDRELDRTVAIKIALGSDADAHARLRREAKHASQLNHPNISTIFEVGTSGDRPFIVMEFVEGRRLADVVPRDGLTPGLVREYGTQIADALAHAHRHGVLHRDLTPANVVVTPDGRAKVLDFGLARRISSESLAELSQSRQTVTADGTLAGTLAYMAPESFRGAPADQRSDVWALGVLLYEMATGERPFRGATAFELCASILHEPPIPMPDSVPESIRTLITRCLEKNPAARCGTADDVRLALQDAPLDAPKSVVPSSFAARCSRRLPLIVPVVLVLLLGYWWSQRPTAPVALGVSGKPAVAIMNFENAGGQDVQWLTQGVPSMLITGLAQARGLDIVSTQRLHEAAKQRGLSDFASLEEAQAGDIARQAGAGAIVTGTIYKAGPDVRIDARVEDLTTGRVLMAQSVRGSDVFALVDQLAMQIRSGVGLPDMAGIRSVADVSTASLDAFRLYTQGVDAWVNARDEDASRAFLAAVRIDPGFAEAYMHLASVAGFGGRPADRRVYLEKAAEHADRLSESRRLLLNLQRARDRDPEEATRLLEEILEKFPETEQAYTIAGLIYGGELRNRDKMLQIMRAGVSALPNSPSIRNDYGYALLESGRYDEAIRQFEKYVELVPREANPYDSLADGHLTSGSAEQAIATYSRGLEIDPGFSASRLGLSWCYAVLGRYDEALAAKPPLKIEQAFLMSRLGRYREASTLLASGRQDAEDARNPGDQSVHLLVSAALALEQRDHARVRRELSAAEKAIAVDIPIRRNRLRVLIELLRGLAELDLGQKEAARARVPLVRELYRPIVEEERFWYRTLDGETALASGDLDAAAAAFAAAQPEGRKPMRWFGGFPTIFVNSPPFRDGLARVAIARGDLRGAIQIYRRLLTYDASSHFIGAFEPRYVLAVARLLEKTGDKAGALREYRRFLEFWKDADPNLPELIEARRAITRTS
jgi:serine/threonine protein kinase/tetratricopeptide (TPR) repeat protein